MQPLSIKLTIPEDDDSTDISNPDFHFTVLIQNVSNHPVTIWKRWCSTGAFNVHFFVNSEDGQKFKVPKEIESGGMVKWAANFPDPLVLQPGEIDVRDFFRYLGGTFQEVAPDLHSGSAAGNSQEFELMPPSRSYGTVIEHKFVMRATLAIPGSDNWLKPLKIWSGTVSSAQETFNLYSTSKTDDFQDFRIEFSPFYSPGSFYQNRWMNAIAPTHPAK